jgi:hypothetical protein
MEHVLAVRGLAVLLARCARELHAERLEDGFLFFVSMYIIHDVCVCVLENTEQQKTPHVTMSDNAASIIPVQKEVHVGSSSRNRKVQFTANLTYSCSCSEDASLRDKKEALEGLLEGLQTYIQHQMGRS